nr:hypothetical protein [Phyllobacterium zundukense]
MDTKTFKVMKIDADCDAHPGHVFPVSAPDRPALLHEWQRLGL